MKRTITSNLPRWGPATCDTQYYLGDLLAIRNELCEVTVQVRDVVRELTVCGRDGYSTNRPFDDEKTVSIDWDGYSPISAVVKPHADPLYLAYRQRWEPHAEPLYLQSAPCARPNFYYSGPWLPRYR